MLRSLTAAVTALALAPAAAHAVDVRVVNERGIPQRAMWSDDGSTPRFMTDADGWIKGVEAGRTLKVTRSTSTQPCYRNPGGAPEGAAGVEFAVTEAGGTITLPNATGPSYRPESDEAERWIVGKINERRAQQGRPPVRISAVLNRVADAVARKQFVESLSFPPPFCPVVVIDWGFPGSGGYSSVDANGADPRKAWEHWSDGSIRETSATLGDWNAVGVGDGGGAWTAYFANCPEGFDARCEMSSDQGDASIVLPSTTVQPPAQQKPGTTPPATSKALNGLTVAARQRGKAVRLTVDVGRAGSAVAVRLRRGSKIVGKVLRQETGAGRLSLRVTLNRKGMALLKARRTLALTVEVVVDPPAGAGPNEQARRPVKLRR